MIGQTAAVIRQAAAVLLTYPDQTFVSRLPLVAQAVADLPDCRARASLLEFCDYAAATGPLELGIGYVDTFDLKRRRSLHLTFYTDGDTRRRGHSLARLKEIYTACGWSLDNSELPDHLTVILEFAARGDTEWGTRMLTTFLPGLELLRVALREHHSPYAAVLDAVFETLPVPSRATRDEALRLAAAGPPVEDVGIDGYAAATMLGMPSMGVPSQDGRLPAGRTR